MTVSSVMPKSIEQSFTPIYEAVDRFFKQGTYKSLDAKRIFHGRGGCFPGLEWCCIDVFNPIVLVTVFEAPPADFENWLMDCFLATLSQQEAGFTHLVVQHRYLPESPSRWLIGEPLERAVARRGGQQFNIRFNRKNIGYFLDMEPGRQWLEARANGKNVLNLFAYTCAFSVVAKAAGANRVVNVDMSGGALTIGRRNHHLNQLHSDDVRFLDLDILKSWSRIRKPGPYDVIVIDPPSFQKGSFVANKDYQKVIRRIPELASPGADILACLNAPELDVAFLQSIFTENCPDSRFVGRLPWSEDFIDADEQKQLKLLHFKYRA